MIKSVFQTPDGRVFKTEEEAQAHIQKELDYQEALTEFKDCANRMKILMDQYKFYSPDSPKNTDYMGSADLYYALERVIEFDFDEDKYFSSACW